MKGFILSLFISSLCVGQKIERYRTMEIWNAYYHTYSKPDSSYIIVTIDYKAKMIAFNDSLKRTITMYQITSKKGSKLKCRDFKSEMNCVIETSDKDGFKTIEVIYEPENKFRCRRRL